MANADCRRRDAPMAGGQLFHALAQLQLPDNIKPTELRSRLEEIAADLMVVISEQSEITGRVGGLRKVRSRTTG